jgi:hypothetical protein
MAGEVELENVSLTDVDIEVRTSPLQYLNLVVTDSQGHVVSESNLFCPLDKPYVLRLHPEQKYVGPVGLLGNVPEVRQRPGKYLVKAVFEYKDLKAVSEPLAVQL